MRKNVARRLLGAALLAALAVGTLGTLGTAVASPPNRCEADCLQAYHQCVPICSKNPCFVSCETVLEICLSNCGSGGGSES